MIVCLAASLRADAGAEIRAVLDAQVSAWNRGDLKEFMKGYKKSEAITFTGKAVTRGYDAVLKRYEGNYGDKAKMGTLRFDEIEIRMLGKTHALVLGRFHLTRTAEGGGDASGRFSLVAELTKEGWKVIHDHTS
jgi:uncharacterized protein (TIGR02246 family)